MGSTTIPLTDWLIVAAYIAATMGLGLWLGWGKASAEGFLLGRRNLSAWMLLLSIVATETSTVTFLSLPGHAFKEGGNLTFLQITFGYIVGRLLVAQFLLPLFFSGQFFTAYEVLQSRFGSTVRGIASSVFLVTRTLSDGLRLFLASLLIEQATGFPFVPSIAILAVSTAIYATVGGVSSVIWNDCLQFAIYTIGAVVALVLLLGQFPGGMSDVWAFGAETGRLELLDFDLVWQSKTINFWSGLIGGAVLTMATHGADHLMVQRYLCARNRQAATWALDLSGPLVAAQFLLFLAIGVALAAFYDTQAVDYSIERPDQALASYVVHELPVGFRGLVIASVLAVTMSTLSSSLNASAGVLVRDSARLLGKTYTDLQEVFAARAATVLFALLQSLVAIGAYSFALQQSVIGAVLAIAGFSAGLVLGLYALGLAAGRASETAGVAGFLSGLVACCYVAFRLELHWAWYSLIGATITFLVGIVVNQLMSPSANSPTE